MISQYVFEQVLSNFKEVLFTKGDTKSLCNVKDEINNLKDIDFIRLLKDIDSQQGATIAKLMLDETEVIHINPLGKFVLKEKIYKDKGIKLDAYFKRVKELNQSNDGKEDK